MYVVALALELRHAFSCIVSGQIDKDREIRKAIKAERALACYGSNANATQ